jgi:Beta propeller domain
MDREADHSDAALRNRRQRRTVTVLAVALVGATSLAAKNAPPASADSRRVPFANFSSCPRLMAYLQSQALPTVGPYGIGSANNQGFEGPFFPTTVPPGTGGRSTKKKATKSTQAPPVTVAAAPAQRPIPAAAPATEAAAAAAPATTSAPAVAAAPAAAVEATPVFTDSSSGGTSTTNVQEIGVDEGDEVETDGRYLYTAIGGAGVRIVDTTTGAVVATIPNYGNGSEPQLILDGTRLAVTRTLFDQFGPETIVELWSVLNPARPELITRTHLEGSAMAVRSVNHRARIVLTTGVGSRIQKVQPNIQSQRDLERATAQNRAFVKAAKVTEWLPRVYDESPTGQVSAVRPALDCREVGKPADPSGLGLVWVATIDLDTAGARVGARGSGGVVTNGGLVYSSATTLYVTTGNNPQFAGGPVPIVRAPTSRPAPVSNTAIHAFDLAPNDGATYLASGLVRGTLLNQFSMSEFGGVLRVASTTPNEGFGTRQESAVHLLTRNGRALTEISSVGGLGRNELIYAVRFLGDLGYVVTFRQTDPLYVLDLRDPRAPKIAGELKIPGYSAYLHPMAPGYLIGVGQDATDAGRRLGTMLQVFDVRDPYNPQQVSKLRIGGNSEAEYDHHAFLWWPQTADAFVPNQNYDQKSGLFSGLVIANVTTTKITERGRIIHELSGPGGGPIPLPAPVLQTTTVPGSPATSGSPAAILPPPRPPQQYQDQIRRAVLVNGRVVTVSPNAVKVSELTNLQPTFYTPFQQFQ